MTSISNGILNKEPPRAEPHAWWCERSENESRKKTASFSSYSIQPERSERDTDAHAEAVDVVHRIDQQIVVVAGVAVKER